MESQIKLRSLYSEYTKIYLTLFEFFVQYGYCPYDKVPSYVARLGLLSISLTKHLEQFKTTYGKPYDPDKHIY